MGSLQSHQNSGRPCIRSKSWSSKRYMNTQLIGGWVKIHTADHLGWKSLCFSQFNTISKALEKRHTNLEEEQRTVSFSTAGSPTTPNTAYLNTTTIFFHNSVDWEFRNWVGNWGDWAGKIHLQAGFFTGWLVYPSALGLSFSPGGTSPGSLRTVTPLTWQLAPRGKGRLRRLATPSTDTVSLCHIPLAKAAKGVMGSTQIKGMEK